MEPAIGGSKDHWNYFMSDTASLGSVNECTNPGQTWPRLAYDIFGRKIIFRTILHFLSLFHTQFAHHNYFICSFDFRRQSIGRISADKDCWWNLTWQGSNVSNQWSSKLEKIATVAIVHLESILKGLFKEDLNSIGCDEIIICVFRV